MNYSKKLSFLLSLFSFSSVLLYKVNAQEQECEIVQSKTIVNADNGNADSSLSEKKEVPSDINNETSKDTPDIEHVDFNSEVNKKDSNLNEKKVDEIVLPSFKYKNYDCQEGCLSKSKSKSYNLVDRYKWFQHSVNKVIFNMCSDCAVKKVLSDPSVNINNNNDLKSTSCNIHYILGLLPNCCSHCYNRVYKAIVMAYCSCSYQFDVRYNIFETAFDNNNDNISYEQFLYSLRSRIFQDYFSEKTDYDSTVNKAKEIDEEIEKNKIFLSKKTHNES